jgi:hypothetical protein
MLFHLLQCTGQSPSTKNYLVPSVSTLCSADSEKSCCRPNPSFLNASFSCSSDSHLTSTWTLTWTGNLALNVGVTVFSALLAHLKQLTGLCPGQSVLQRRHLGRGRGPCSHQLPAPGQGCLVYQS